MHSKLVFIALIFIIAVTSFVNCHKSSSSEHRSFHHHHHHHHKTKCYEEIKITCCSGSTLVTYDETTAACVQCLPAGSNCYESEVPCCPGYQCASGPIARPPNVTDTCILESIRG